MKAIARYFGFGDDEVTPLRLMRQHMLRSSWRVLALAGVATVAAILLVDWRPEAMALGALIGIAVFGPVEYFSDVRKRVPDGALRPAPIDAAWEGATLARAPFIALMRTVALTAFALASLIWALPDLGSTVAGLFVPGQLIGYTLAELVGAWQVRDWERRHGLFVAFRHDGGELQRFAVDPLRVQ